MCKYKMWYNSIICNAKNRMLSGYVEIHHILPRSLGGTDEVDNLVQLTAREHFLCHILLTKFTYGQDRLKMLHACIMMKANSTGQHRYMNSRLYDEVRRKYSMARKGVNNSWNTGLTKDTSEKLREIGAKISSTMKGRPSKKKGTIGNPASDETKRKMSETRKGKYLWWNDGEKSIRSTDIPGDGWVRGRLTKDMSPTFLKK